MSKGTDPWHAKPGVAKGLIGMPYLLEILGGLLWGLDASSAHSGGDMTHGLYTSKIKSGKII